MYKYSENPISLFQISEEICCNILQTFVWQFWKSINFDVKSFKNLFILEIDISDIKFNALFQLTKYYCY